MEKRTDAPAQLHKELGMTSSIIRDLFTDNVDRMVVDTKELYREIVAYLRTVSPDLRKRVEYYRDRKPIFDAFGIKLSPQVLMTYTRKRVGIL